MTPLAAEAPVPQTVHRPASLASPFAWIRHGAAFVLLAAATLLAHGWSLGDGLALDDHWHYRTIRNCAWTPQALLNATTIDVEELFDVWWQREPVRFAYARPVAVALLKATYAVTGGSPVAAHAVSLLLHFAASLLVYVLALRLTGRWTAAIAGSLAFVIFPQSVFAVGWLAAQNAVLATLLMLAGLLAYMRATGLPSAEAPSAVPPLQLRWFALAAAGWLLALFSRENALMLPAIFIAADLGWGGRRWLWARIRSHVLILAAAAGYLVWRVGAFREHMPDVYVGRPNGDYLGFVAWAAAKLLHYISSVVWPAPLTVGPTGRYAPWTERPLDQLAALAIVVFIVSLYALTARRRRGWWIWPAWVLLAILPVVPVLATPHSGYLAAPGVALGLALSLAGEKRNWRVALGRFVVVFLVLGAYAASVKAARLMWRGMAHAETFTVTDVRDDPPPAGVTDVFCLNLPFAAIYTPFVLAETEPDAPQPSPRWHVLTFAPHLVRMEERCRLTRPAPNVLEVEVGPTAYFSGLLGRFLLAGFGRPERFASSDLLDATAFKVDVLEADAAGVHRLRFTFPEPVDSPRYCFYLSSYTCGALRLTFPDRAPAPAGPGLPEFSGTAAEVRHACARTIRGDAAAGEMVLAGLTSPDPRIREAATTAVEILVAPLADALAAPAPPRHSDAGADAAELLAWWRHHVDDATLRHVFHERWDRWEIRHRRDELKRGRALAAEWIRSDVYFTGPPFPDPR